MSILYHMEPNPSESVTATKLWGFRTFPFSSEGLMKTFRALPYSFSRDGKCYCFTKYKAGGVEMLLKVIPSEDR